ncbi:uncharacterized protein TNCV_4128911 [Trichonephila clavipes]|nr:uncharacterized protein TNCV_4128911 [Trichonephila clavipes]
MLRPYPKSVRVNHETCYTSRLLPSSSQKSVFDKDNGKASSFKPDAVPENHFHLGSHNYAVVSDFCRRCSNSLPPIQDRCHWISFTYQRWNHCNTFRMVSPLSMLKETEWNILKDIHKQITSKTVSIMFGRVFLKLLRKEVAKHIPFPKSDCVDCIDVEMVLTTSMVELLCNHIEENISSLFVCFGCLEGYENQLGHE